MRKIYLEIRNEVELRSTCRSICLPWVIIQTVASEEIRRRSLKGNKWKTIGTTSTTVRKRQYDADMAMTGLRAILQSEYVHDSQMSPRSLNQVKPKGMPFSFWSIKSDPAVLEASREWRGSWCYPLEVGGPFRSMCSASIGWRFPCCQSSRQK